MMTVDGLALRRKVQQEILQQKREACSPQRLRDRGRQMWHAVHGCL